MASYVSTFASRFNKAFAAVGLGVRSSATQADGSVPLLTSGTAAPSASNPNGSLYLRDVGPYARVAGAWQALPRAPLTLSAAARAGGGPYTCDVTVTGPANVATYRASFICQAAGATPTAYTVAVNGTGTEIATDSNNYTVQCLFSTTAAGVAVLRVTDPGEENNGYLLVEPAALAGDGGQYGTAALVLIPFGVA